MLLEPSSISCYVFNAFFDVFAYEALAKLQIGVCVKAARHAAAARSVRASCITRRQEAESLHRLHCLDHLLQ